MSATSAKPRILVLPVPTLYQRLFGAEADQALRQVGDVTFNDQPKNYTSADLAKVIGDYDAVVTGWGSPKFDDGVLAAAGRLRLVAHSAGSIKHLLPPALFQKGIAVTHAAAAIAPAVAEWSLLMALTLLRRAPHIVHAMQTGGWDEAAKIPVGEEIEGTRVGVVGAGYTGRCFIEMLRALKADVWVSDPYLTDDRAAAMGVKKVGLEELLRNCRVVSLQAPSTKETHRMIGKAQFDMLQDGAIFINTARSWLLDEPALIAELKRGRIVAALDVFEDEPLPKDSPFYTLPNVFLSPHVAGASQQTARRQGQYMVDELRRFFAGEPLRYPVTLQMLETMA